MANFRRCAKPLSYFLAFSLISLGIQLPAAHASMIGTEAVINAAQVQQDRQRLHDVLSRADVKTQLIAHGADPAQVQARVDSLTDQEAQTLAAKLDQMPAGGDMFGLGDAVDLAVFVFLVLLITDILGFTSVYPFVKHPKR